MNKDIQKQIVKEIGSEVMKIALSTLPPDTENVIRLYYEKGKSFSEICTLVNKSISVVRNHHNRGLFLLQKFYAENKPVVS